MLKVGICDDGEQFACTLERYILQYAEINSIKVDTQVFTLPEKLLRHIQKEGVFDLLFLDIQLGKMTGVELAKELRSDLKNEIIQIVFVSAFQHYALQLFDIRLFNFLVKPIEYKDIEYIMDEYSKLYKFLPNYFEYSIGKQSFKINTQTIIYFQSCGKKVRMVTQDGEKEFYGKLSDIILRINENCFCAVHKSYVVNIRYVSRYGADSVLMVNGETVPVSRSMRGSVNKYIMEND